MKQMTVWPPARADARVGQGAQPGSKKLQMQGAKMLGRAQQIVFLFFFFVIFVVAMKCNAKDGLFTKSSVLEIH